MVKKVKGSKYPNNYKTNLSLTKRKFPIRRLNVKHTRSERSSGGNRFSGEHWSNNFDRASFWIYFSPPHIDASTEVQIVQDLINNAAAMYEGFLVYITNAATGEPFVQPNKFYFWRRRKWFPSPFNSVILNHAPNVNPLYEVSIPTSGTETLPFSLDLPAELFQDQDGDPLVYTATQTDGSPLPAWLSFDATNTILSGTPTESDIGLYNITITATDPGNLSASTTQEIQIFAKPVPFWAGGTHFSETLVIQAG